MLAYHSTVNVGHNILTDTCFAVGRIDLQASRTGTLHQAAGQIRAPLFAASVFYGALIDF